MYVGIQFILSFYMQNKNYKNFTDQKQEEITVGVPISQLPQHPPHQPYFQPNFPQPHPFPHPQLLPDQQTPRQIPNPYNPNSSFSPIQVQPHPQPQMGAQPVPPPMMLDYSRPINMRCPCCGLNVTTVINQEAGNAAYLWAGLLCFFVSPCCACLPFLTDKCMDKAHYCPHCGFNILKKHKGFCDCQ